MPLIFRVFSSMPAELRPRNGAPESEPLSESDAMAVDENRVQAVFLAVVEAADPVRQAAILDRECASDAEMRQRVEALLRAHRESATILDQSTASPFGTAPSSSDGTMVLDSSADEKGSSVTTPNAGPVTERDGSKEDEEPLTLDFLEPSQTPGSLGRLGHHEVLQVLGRGGFGIVVRAFDESLQRIVAIKVMSPQLASTSPARKRFLREARASARVRHENVVQIYAVEERPLPYLVMEYIPGETLQQRIDQTGPLEVPDVLRIGGQIARGLAAAHEQGLIHRDIKPGNILLENGVDLKVKITDFGLARAADDASLSQSGVIAGTPLYMAPEQAKGEPTDPRADLFSLGSVLYTMSSGRPPFRAATALAVLKRVAEDTPRSIRQIIPEVPQWLCDLISRLHAKDPADRFQSAAEVAALLEQHLAHLQHPSQFPSPVMVKAPRQPKSRKVAVLASATALLAALGAVMTYPLWRTAGPTSVPPKTESPVISGGQVRVPATVPAKRPGTGPLTSHVLQGPTSVRDALIDFSEPERRFGSQAQDNALRRADQCNALLARFDLAGLGLPRNTRVEKATVSLYVWDPSSSGKTKICAFPLKTAWDESSVTWQQPAAGKSWQGGERFAFGADTGPAGPAVVVSPEQGSDTVDPPIEYQLDVTDFARSWVAGEMPNYGIAIAPEIDASVDEGFLTRFQVFGSEYREGQYSPKLTLQVRQ
jgi:Protein kinase domain